MLKVNKNMITPSYHVDRYVSRPYLLENSPVWVDPKHYAPIHNLAVAGLRSFEKPDVTSQSDSCSSVDLSISSYQSNQRSVELVVLFCKDNKGKISSRII